MDRDFKLGEREFKLSKIDAFKQFHIVRRIAPLLSEMLPALQGVKKDVDKLSESEKLDQFAKIATPVMNGLSKLSDADADLVLMGLLQAVEIKQATGWAYVAKGPLLMIQDLELPTLLQLAGRAFMYNLSGFFSALPQK